MDQISSASAALQRSPYQPTVIPGTSWLVKRQSRSASGAACAACRSRASAERLARIKSTTRVTTSTAWIARRSLPQACCVRVSQIKTQPTDLRKKTAARCALFGKRATTRPRSARSALRRLEFKTASQSGLLWPCAARQRTHSRSSPRSRPFAQALGQRPAAPHPSDGSITQYITPLFGPTCLGAQT
jgi:hypothetical protein